MKNIRKTGFLFALVLGGAVMLAGCREDEKLDLPGYPSSEVGVTIPDADNASVVKLKAVYDNAGKINLDGEVTRTYVLALSTPSKEDVLLLVEPLLVNIPAEKVEISKRELRIAAGYRETEPVTVTFTDPDFSFAEPEKQAQTYELGVKVLDARGEQVALAGDGVAKVVIDKVAYEANCSVVGQNGNTVNFKRAYANGAILNEEPMEYTFKVQLDRPAEADIKLSFTTGGLPEAFVKDVTLTPSEVTIPAGAVESGEIKWALTDDFLLTTDEAENYKVTLTTAFESTDPTVKPAEGADVLTFNIAKAFDIIDLVDGAQDNWAMYDPEGWTLTGEGGSSWGLDGILEDDGDYYGYGATLSITIDMKEVKELLGLRVSYYATYYATKTGRIETSIDGESWTELGTKEELPSTKAHYFKLLSPAQGRFVRFTSVKSGSSGHDITGIRIYGAK